jgi:hypothetical protein
MRTRIAIVPAIATSTKFAVSAAVRSCGRTRHDRRGCAGRGALESGAAVNPPAPGSWLIGARVLASAAVGPRLQPTTLASESVMNWFRLTFSRSAAFVSAACSVRGMRRSRRPLGVASDLGSGMSRPSFSATVIQAAIAPLSPAIASSAVSARLVQSGSSSAAATHFPPFSSPSCTRVMWYGRSR